MKFILIFFLLIIFGGILLTFAFSAKKKIDRNQEILNGEIPKDISKDDIQKGKSQRQQELELLLINSNPLLHFLGLLDKNIKWKLGIMMLLASVYYLFNIQQDKNTLIIGFLVIFVAIIVLPNMISGSILQSKIKRIMVDLPGFIDLVAVNLQAGFSIEASMKQVALDFKRLNNDLTVVMLRIIRRAEITGMAPALQDLAVALPTTEIRMFCTVLQQSLNFGSSIYGHLIQLSADIREIQLLRIEEKLGTLAAKMSIPLILLIMFPIIILIVAPGAMRVLPNVF